MNRRKFIKRILQASALAAVPALYSWQIEPYWLEFVERKLPIKYLPPQWEGRILMQISDLHVGDRFDWHYLIESFQKAKDFKSDIVVYTGDFVQHGNEQERQYLQEVLSHAVHGKVATLGILGNHDYGINWAENEVADAVTEIATSCGISMLLNEFADIQGLHFMGFEDLWSSRFLPGLALRNFQPDNANIVLCHNPDACDLDIWQQYNSWILSGHTHGGQCRLPGIGAPIVPVKNKNYVAGEVDLKDGRMLYINRALGHSYPVRFLVRPEITVFTLTKANQ